MTELEDRENLPAGDIVADIDAAARDCAYGNPYTRDPTPAQQDAGNYKKGRVRIGPLRCVIENPRGTYRSGVGAGGLAWRNMLAAHYGYISGTRGNDGDQVDCFIGAFPDSDKAWVINQFIGGRFDEHKVMLAFPTESAARAAYQDSYQPGWKGLESIVPMSIEQLRLWLRDGDMSRPASASRIPAEGSTMINKVLWDQAGQPLGMPLPVLMYNLRLDDVADGQLLEPMTAEDLAEAFGVEAAIALDGIVVTKQMLAKRMSALERVMEAAAAAAVKPTGFWISEPKLRKMFTVSTVNIDVIFALADGQTVTICFHNPDTTPQRLLPGDELISWKWLLNKRDVTVVVAPERGAELNIREVARRIARLAEKNHATFVRANATRNERDARIEKLKAEEAELDEQLERVNRDIDAARIDLEEAFASQVFRPGDEVMVTMGPRRGAIVTYVSTTEGGHAVKDGAGEFEAPSVTLVKRAPPAEPEPTPAPPPVPPPEPVAVEPSAPPAQAFPDVAGGAQPDPVPEVPIEPPAAVVEPPVERVLVAAAAAAAVMADPDGERRIEDAIAAALAKIGPSGAVLTGDGISWAVTRTALRKMTASGNSDGAKPYLAQRIQAVQVLPELAATAKDPLIRDDDGRDPMMEKVYEYFTSFAVGGQVLKVRLLCKKFKADAQRKDKMHSLGISMDDVGSGSPGNQDDPAGVLIDLEVLEVVEEGVTGAGDNPGQPLPSSVAEPSVAPADSQNASAEVTAAKSFLEMTPDEQRAAIAAEALAVSNEQILQVIETWSKASADYAVANQRVTGSVVPGPEYSFVGGKIERVDGITLRDATAEEMAEIEAAIRTGAFQIVVKPRIRDGQSGPALKVLYAATGKFHPFEYSYELLDQSPPDPALPPEPVLQVNPEANPANAEALAAAIAPAPAAEVPNAPVPESPPVQHAPPQAAETVQPPEPPPAAPVQLDHRAVDVTFLTDVRDGKASFDGEDIAAHIEQIFVRYPGDEQIEGLVVEAASAFEDFVTAAAEVALSARHPGGAE